MVKQHTGEDTMRSKSWIEYTNKAKANGMVGYYRVRVQVNMTGDIAHAIFGTFEKINDNWAEYCETLWTDSTGKIEHPYEDEYRDDLKALRDGRVDWY